jgi:hypothetical protein
VPPALQRSKRKREAGFVGEELYGEFASCGIEVHAALRPLASAAVDAFAHRIYARPGASAKRRGSQARGEARDVSEVRDIPPNGVCVAGRLEFEAHAHASPRAARHAIDGSDTTQLGQRERESPV